MTGTNPNPTTGGAPGLARATASHFAEHVLASVRREFPNKLDHMMSGPEEVLGPKALHPSFYGCFDWHSCVHGHWMLLRLLRAFPDLAEGAAIRAVMDEDLAPERIRAERDYFVMPGHRSFERTYGWAWLLKLAGELEGWDTAQGRRWAEGLRPLTAAVAAAFADYLPRLDFPIRHGVHPNTAFSLGLALDHARAAGDAALERLLVERAHAYYGKDVDGPLRWEPSGEEFLSPCLEEAALMAKVLRAEAFKPWLDAFLPGLPAGLAPVRVSDRSDPKIVHLDGLNLSRARCLRTLAAALGAGDPRREPLLASAAAHAQAALPHVITGNYGGDHWLATFAVHMLEEG